MDVTRLLLPHACYCLPSATHLLLPPLSQQGPIQGVGHAMGSEGGGAVGLVGPAATAAAIAYAPPSHSGYHNWSIILSASLWSS